MDWKITVGVRRAEINQMCRSAMSARTSDLGEILSRNYYTSDASSFYTFQTVKPQVLLETLVRSWNSEAQARHMVEFWQYVNGWRYSFRTFSVIMYYFKVEKQFVEGHDLAVILTPEADEGANINAWERSVYENNLDRVARRFNAKALPLEIAHCAEEMNRRTIQLMESDLDMLWQ